MRIGFEAKRIFHNRTGLGNYSRDLIRILQTHHPENEYFLYNPIENNNLLFKVTPPTYEKLPETFFDRQFPNLWRQMNILKDLRKDQIQIFHGLSGELPWGLHKKNIKSIVTIHDLIFLRYPEFYSFFDKKIHTKKFSYAAKKADVVVAVSEQTKKDIVEFFGVKPSRIQVIYQGCHRAFKKSFSQEEKENVLKKYGLPREYILNVGTIEVRKNVLIAVKAIRDIDTHLVIVGSETPYAREVKAYIKTHNLEKKVSFLKNLSVEELAMLNQEAQLVIYPSLFEGFGIPIIEALYSKTPVITSNYGCFPEAGGPHSAYIDPTNEEDVAANIKRILSDKNLQQSMSEKGFAYVQKFNDEAIATQFMAIYKNIVV